MKTVYLLVMVLFFNSTHALELHTGLNGPWHQPENPGQGLVLHIIPENNQIFIAWFTYAEAGGQQMWLTADGNLNEQPIELTIYESTNGKLNSSDPLPELTIWGTGSIEFTSCEAASFSFNKTGGQSGTIALSRITAPINCSEV